MKRPRPQSLTAKLKRRLDETQELVLPQGLLPWRLGQRVWFLAVEGQIEISVTPQGCRGMRRHSRRVRRGMRSLLNDRLR